MSNVRPATVIVLDGLRACLCPKPQFPFRRLPCRITRLQFSSASRGFAKTYSTASPQSPELQDRSIDLTPRALRWPPTPSKEEEVAHVVRTAGRERLYELLRIEASRGNFQRVQTYAETLIRKHGQEPNLRMYSALILANSSPHGSIASVKDYITQLRNDGFDLDLGACHDIIRVLAVHPDYLFRTEILDYMQVKWLQLSDVGRHDLVAGLLRETSFEMALDELDLMKSEGIRIQPWLYDLAIYALAQQAEFDEALRILKARIGDGDLNISGALWTYLLDVGSDAIHYEMTSYVWKKRVQTRYQNPPTGVFLNVLTAAARHGDIDLATDVFKELGNREVIFEYQHYEMLIEAYVNAGLVSTALSVLCVMQESRMIPNDNSTRPIFKYLKKSPDRPNELFEELRFLHHDGKSVPTAVVNCVIEAAVYHNDIELAVEFYKALHEICPSGANTETFNKLLRGCSRVDPTRKDIALVLASELLALGLKPDRITYDRMLLTCIRHPGDYEDALQYYKEMQMQRLEPRTATMLSLVKRMTKEMDERVFDIINQMENMEIRASIGHLKKWVRLNWKGDQRWTQEYSTNLGR